jgi:hypothetical protein
LTLLYPKGIILSISYSTFSSFNEDAILLLFFAFLHSVAMRILTRDILCGCYVLADCAYTLLSDLPELPFIFISCQQATLVLSESI